MITTTALTRAHVAMSLFDLLKNKEICNGQFFAVFTINELDACGVAVIFSKYIYIINQWFKKELVIMYTAQFTIFFIL